MSTNWNKMIEVDDNIWIKANSIRKIEVCDEEVLITLNQVSCGGSKEPMSVKFEDHRNACRAASRIISELNEEE